MTSITSPPKLPKTHLFGSLTRRIRDGARSLNEFALRGRVVPEADDPLIRELLIGSYRMIYRVSEDQVIVLAVVHGARDLGGFEGQ